MLRQDQSLNDILQMAHDDLSIATLWFGLSLPECEWVIGCKYRIEGGHELNRIEMQLDHLFSMERSGSWSFAEHIPRSDQERRILHFLCDFARRQGLEGPYDDKYRGVSAAAG